MLVLLAAETTLDDSEVRALVAELVTLLASLLALARMLLDPEPAVDATLDADERIEETEADADEPIAEASLLALETEETTADCWERAVAVLMSLAYEVPWPWAETRRGATKRMRVDVNFMLAVVMVVVLGS